MKAHMHKAIVVMALLMVNPCAFSAQMSGLEFNSPSTSVVSRTCRATPVDQTLSAGDLYFLTAAAKASPKYLNPLLASITKERKISEKERKLFCSVIEQKELTLN